MFESFTVLEGASSGFRAWQKFLAWLGDNGLHEYRFPDGALDEFTETEQRVWQLRRDRVARGDYTVPLPPPVERRRIREQAGWTQEDLGDELNRSRDLVSRWENPAVGYVGEERLPGREPSGEIRREYARLLQELRKTAKNVGSGQSS